MTKLQMIRKEKMLSQRELAEMSGISIRMIQHYEQGRFNFANIGVDIMIRLALALNCNLSDLLDGQAEQNAKALEKMVKL